MTTTTKPTTTTKATTITIAKQTTATGQGEKGKEMRAPGISYFILFYFTIVYLQQNHQARNASDTS